MRRPPGVAAVGGDMVPAGGRGEGERAARAGERAVPVGGRAGGDRGRGGGGGAAAGDRGAAGAGAVDGEPGDLPEHRSAGGVPGGGRAGAGRVPGAAARLGSGPAGGALVAGADQRHAEEFPDEPEMRVSHETIYQSIYVQGRGALRRELAVCLRTGRALRKPRRHADERRGRIKDMVMIADRPAEAEDRAVPGHWEGDLIMGARNASAIGTLVERSTRFVLLLHLPSGHDAAAVAAAMTEAMAALPAQLRRSLAWDQGHEMAAHARVTAATGLAVYFCDPHSPWQRGSNENTNGLLRQYFPKGTDLSVH